MYRELSSAARMFAAGLIVLFLCLMTLWACGMATAHEKQGWWDHPRVRACCSVADAVFADQWKLLPDGSIEATVTEATRQTVDWAQVLVGKTYIIHADRVIDVPGNPTGRALLFISPTAHVPLCFAYGPLI